MVFVIKLTHSSSKASISTINRIFVCLLNIYECVTNFFHKKWFLNTTYFSLWVFRKNMAFKHNYASISRFSLSLCCYNILINQIIHQLPTEWSLSIFLIYNIKLILILSRNFKVNKFNYIIKYLIKFLNIKHVD